MTDMYTKTKPTCLLLIIVSTYLVYGTIAKQAAIDERYMDKSPNKRYTNASRPLVQGPARPIPQPATDLKTDMSSLEEDKAEDSNDFNRGLKALKRIIRSKNPTKFDQSFQSNSIELQSHVNSSIEDDINTINVLIGMLMLANRRLINQRDQAQLHSGSDVTNKTIDRLAASSNQRLLSVPAPSSITKSISPKLPGAKKFKSSNARSTSPTNQAATTRQTKKQDISLVKAGFDRSDADELTLAQSGQYMERRQDDIFGTIKHPHDLLSGHRPLVARDLLNINREPNQMPHQHDKVPLTTSIPAVAPPLLFGRPSIAQDRTPDLFAGLDKKTPQQVDPSKHYPTDFLIQSYDSRHGGAAKPDLPPMALPNDQPRLDYEFEVRKRQDQMRQAHLQAMDNHRRAHEHALARISQSHSTKRRPAHQRTTKELAQEPEENQHESGLAGNTNVDRKQTDDSEFKGFGNMIDTDFTDLFPPGILSGDEIKEMQRQQQEQKESQERQEQDESDGDEQDDQDQVESPNEKGSAEQSEAETKEPPSSVGLTREATDRNSTNITVNDTSQQRSRLPKPLALPDFLGSESGRSSSKKNRRAEPEQSQEAAQEDRWNWSTESGEAAFDESVDQEK